MHFFWSLLMYNLDQVTHKSFGVLFVCEWICPGYTTGACYDFFPSSTLKNHKDTLLLSACEKNQAQCKISATTLSVKERTNYFIIFILYKLLPVQKWWRKTVCHMYILNLVKVWLQLNKIFISINLILLEVLLR